MGGRTKLRKSAVVSKAALSAAIAVMLLTQASATERALEQLPKFTDSRDKQTYRKVTIGKQTWMAENLNFATEASRCYEDKTSNCEKYGRLYSWAGAKKACPPGWHLPSEAEWTTLGGAVGGNNIAGKKLKTTSGWVDNGNGTNDFTFSALPGGMNTGKTDGFNDLGEEGWWWSATKVNNEEEIWIRFITADENELKRDDSDEDELLSVRCVQD